MTAEATKIAPAAHAPASAVGKGMEVDANICLLTEPQSLAAEAVRSLRTQIVARHVDAGRRALAMVAPTAECGLTTLSLNLAIALAQTGIRTLLVDADLRTPSVTSALGITSNAGLTGILNGSIGDMDDVIIRDVVTNLAILPAGGTPGQPHELLASSRFRQIVRETMREYDLTLYDTSPANQSPDAIAVANAAGYAAIVSRRDHSYSNDVRTLTGQLSDAGSVVIGSILNVF
jgi:capsular exopolysaccharide synthesis family protein